MAARRLIAIMIVLLITSSLAAALAPSPESESSEDSPAEAPAVSEAPRNDGRALRATIEVGGKRRPTVRARVGDQLQLRIAAKRALTIELLGETDTLTPTAPARLDLLLEARGEFPIVDLRSRRLLGTVVVARAASSADERRRTRSRRDRRNRPPRPSPAAA